MTKIREEKRADKVLDSLCQMVEPPTLEAITRHLEKQIRAASLIGLVFGKQVAITITPDLRDDGLIHGFQCKMNAEEYLEKIGEMTIEEVTAKIGPQLAENIRRETGPDIGNFLEQLFSRLTEDDDEEGDDDQQQADAGNGADVSDAAQATSSQNTDGEKQESDKAA